MGTEDLTSHADVAAVVWVGLGLVLTIFGILFLFEGWLIFHNQPAITPYIRLWTVHHSLLADFVSIGLVAAMAAAFTHFVLDR